MNDLHKNKTEKHLAALFGLKQETIGKTQARQEFLPLVDQLSLSAKAIEITDRNKPVAVLVSYNHWSSIISKLVMLMKPIPSSPAIDLIGSVIITGDLGTANKKIADKFKQAMKKNKHDLRGD